MRSPTFAKKNAENAENAAKNATENAIFLQWCMPPPQTLMFVKMHVDLLTPLLFSRDYGPDSTCKAW